MVLHVVSFLSSLLVVEGSIFYNKRERKGPSRYGYSTVANSEGKWQQVVSDVPHSQRMEMEQLFVVVDDAPEKQKKAEKG